ncbi:MAG: hypothetical protein ACFFG0_51780, partial [Candidatus Thorarchaeota archaeon]
MPPKKGKFIQNNIEPIIPVKADIIDIKLGLQFGQKCRINFVNGREKCLFIYFEIKPSPFAGIYIN